MFSVIRRRILIILLRCSAQRCDTTTFKIVAHRLQATEYLHGELPFEYSIISRYSDIDFRCLCEWQTHLHEYGMARITCCGHRCGHLLIAIVVTPTIRRNCLSALRTHGTTDTDSASASQFNTSQILKLISVVCGRTRTCSRYSQAVPLRTLPLVQFLVNSSNHLKMRLPHLCQAQPQHPTISMCQILIFARSSTQARGD